MSVFVFSVLQEDEARMLLNTDDDRLRVEESCTLIPDVGSEGRQCGSVNNIRVFEEP